MLDDVTRAAVNTEANRRFPHTGAGGDLDYHRAVRRLSFRQGAEWAIGDALGYIDQTMYANESSEYIWTNVEMLEILRYIRDLLAVPNRPDGGEEKSND